MYYKNIWDENLDMIYRYMVGYLSMGNSAVDLHFVITVYTT